MATVAEQITELESELTAVKAAMTSALTGGQSFQLGDMSITGTNYNALSQRRKELEKAIQRLRNGGRGIVVDMSARADGGTT